MKLRAFLILTVTLGLVMGLIGFTKGPQQTALTFDWLAFGKTLNKGAKHKLGTADAKQFVARVADQMARLKVPVNTGWGGRTASKLRFGQQDVGTCTWINDAVQKALHGAGFRQDQIFGVIGVGQGSEVAGVAGELEEKLRTAAWLNIQHIAPAIVIGNSIVVFDLWHHIYDTGSFSGMAASSWNGRGLSQWCTGVKEYPGFMFSTYGAMPTGKPVHPNTLQELIQESQYHQRFPNAKRTPTTTPATGAQQSANQVPKVSHWAFVEAKAVPIDNPPNTRDPRRFDRGKAEGGKGTLTVTSEWNDMQLNTHSCTVTMTWSADKDLTYLVPGQKFTLKGSVTIAGETDRSSVGIHWHPAGFPAHVGHTSGINLFGKDYYGKGEAFECTGEAPAKDRYPQGVMVLRFIAYARGYGAVEYTYKWVDKK
ncbi:MAG: hypothetical protein IT363_13615 [Methanoregulaceae archaeon]|nr:hypothetical protein [Methanoregulaceae archaeon]